MLMLMSADWHRWPDCHWYLLTYIHGAFHRLMIKHLRTSDAGLASVGRVCQKAGSELLW